MLILQKIKNGLALNIRLISVICLCFSSFSLVAFAQSSVSAEIESLKSIYDQNLSAIDREYSEKDKAWPEEYQKELDGLLKRMQKAGDLDGWQFVNNEVTRFRDYKFIPPNAITPTAGELQTIQKKYQVLSSGLEVEKSKKIISLTEKYVARLTSTQKNLTIAGKIDDALLANSEIKRVKSLPKVSAAEFALMSTEAEKPEEQKTPSPEEKKKAEDAPKAAAAQPAAEAAADTSKTKIYDGQTPPQIPGVNLKTIPLSGTERMRVSKTISANAMIGKKSAVTTSSSASMYYATHERSGSNQHFVRMNVRVSNANSVLENSILVVQIFGKNLSGKGSYLDLRTDVVKLPKLEGGKQVYIDCVPVITSVASQRSLSSYSSYISSASNSGTDFYGLIISVFDGQGTLLYQGASTDKLEKMGITTVPEEKVDPDKLRDQMRAAGGALSEARSRCISSPNSPERFEAYLAASNQFVIARTAFFEAIGSPIPPFPPSLSLPPGIPPPSR